MKFVSIVIINQIRVISKQRIYDPKTEFDILSGIRLSNEKLNLIDEKMKKMFIKNIELCHNLPCEKYMNVLKYK